MQNDIIFGIHHAVKEAAAKAPATLSDSHFDLSEAKKEYSLTREGTDFMFKDYSPAVFHFLRTHFKVSPDEFLASWTIEENSKLEESTARSGSLFYKTNDSKYLFKTILHPEVAAMEDLLKDYYHHCINEPGSFIVRIYGLFRIAYSFQKQVWVLVMGNSLPAGVKMDQVFDLKGRTPKKGKGPTEREPQSRGARKDNEITRKVLFYPSAKEFFISQLEKDVEVLRKHNIMDYSLLVGIHKLTAEEKAVLPQKGEKKKKKEAKQLERAAKMEDAKVFLNQGLMARDPQTGEDEIIFLGIIDNLTNFTAKKKVANFCKSFLWDPETLSTVEADYYAKRFTDWMTKNLMADEESDLRPEEVVLEEYVTRMRSLSTTTKLAKPNTPTSSDGGSKKNKTPKEEKGSKENLNGGTSKTLPKKIPKVKPISAGAAAAADQEESGLARAKSERSRPDKASKENAQLSRVRSADRLRSSSSGGDGEKPKKSAKGATTVSTTATTTSTSIKRAQSARTNGNGSKKEGEGKTEKKGEKGEKAPKEEREETKPEKKAEKAEKTVVKGEKGEKASKEEKKEETKAEKKGEKASKEGEAKKVTSSNKEGGSKKGEKAEKPESKTETTEPKVEKAETPAEGKTTKAAKTKKGDKTK